MPEGRRTAESIVGVADIRATRVDAPAGVCNSKKTTYAQNQFALCPDAVTGSYEWLAAARRCNLVCLVVRAFESDSLYHPAGTVDPARDCDNLEAELLLAYMRMGSPPGAGFSGGRSLPEADSKRPHGGLPSPNVMPAADT